MDCNSSNNVIPSKVMSQFKIRRFLQPNHLQMTLRKKINSKNEKVWRWIEEKTWPVNRWSSRRKASGILQYQTLERQSRSQMRQIKDRIIGLLRRSISALDWSKWTLSRMIQMAMGDWMLTKVRIKRIVNSLALNSLRFKMMLTKHFH